MRYQRFISYLYYYKDGEKVENTGYVKVEQKGGMIRISLRSKLKESNEPTYYVYLIMGQPASGGGNHGLLLAQLEPKNGMLTYQYVAGQEQGFGGDFVIDDFVGVLIRGQQAIYMTVWQDMEILPEQIMCVEHVAATQVEPRYSEEKYGEEDDETAEKDMAQADTEQMDEQSGEEVGEIDTNDTAKEDGDLQSMSSRATEYEDKEKYRSGADYLFKNRSSLPAVEGSQLLDCVRIEPKDLGLLDMQNWRYGNNSFLSHGYYRYRYLLLGKLKFQDNSVKIILGVPSIYTNKEKYLANMFGFEQFVTARRTDRKLGQFGYWLVELN